MMHYRSLEEIKLENSWLTVGVFDGVHRGHQEVINRLVQGAHAEGSLAVVLTFDPHPGKFFRKGDEIKLLSLPGERARCLGILGVDVVITHPFDMELANVTAFDFMKRLKAQLGLTHLILGYDSTLGKDREGNAARLTEIGSELGYSVEVVSALGDESGVISSTEIRKLITVGKVEDAAQLMGHPYQLQGLVAHGDQRGRTIGFPTANLDYAREKVIPAGGIYACWAYLGEEKHKAAGPLHVDIGGPEIELDRRQRADDAVGDDPVLRRGRPPPADRHGDDDQHQRRRGDQQRPGRPPHDV
jgi:riboflavin kinase/FMN adenylyltransferase